jgi:hypothetical protein
VSEGWYGRGPMARMTLAVVVSVVAASFAACGNDDASVSLYHGSLKLHADEVTIAPGGVPAAHVWSDGRLTIGGTDVAASTDQRMRLVDYYRAAAAITQHAVDTGKAGADVGLAAANEVVKGLASGNTSQIGAKVEAKARDVKRQAAKMCDDLVAMRAAQEALAATLEQFRPYTVVSDKDVADCRKDLSPQ